MHRLCHSDLLTLMGDEGPPLVSPDGSRIATLGRGRKMAKVWDTRTGGEVFTLKGHTDFVSTRAVFSPDGSRIVAAGDHTVISPVGSFIEGVAVGDHTVKVWDAKTGAELHTLKGHTDFVFLAVFSPDGTRIVTASHDRMMKVRDHKTTVKVWDAKTGAEVFTIDTGTIYRTLEPVFSPDGTRIVTASDHTAKVWDAKTGAKVHTLRGHTDFVSMAMFSPDGSRIVTGCDNWVKGSYPKTIMKVWDAKTGAEVFTFNTGHGYPEPVLVFSPAGRGWSPPI